MSEQVIRVGIIGTPGPRVGPSRPSSLATFRLGGEAEGSRSALGRHRIPHQADLRKQ